MSQLNILVIGCGSIGKRHIRNLKKLNVGDIHVCDKSKERLAEVEESLSILRSYSDYKTAFGENTYHAVFICVPTSLHISPASYAAEQGAHVFLEKPLAHSLEGVDELIQTIEAKKVKLMVGYHLRFHPAVQRLKEIVDQEVLGKVYSYRVECGQYLPDWHPWEDYRNFYMSKKDQGGGALLDITHDIDYPKWLFGRVEKVNAMVGTVSDLDITSDDLADLLIRHDNGIIGHIHLDLLQRDYQRSIKIIGQKGTLIWDYVDQTIKIYTIESKSWKTETVKEAKGELYIQEISHFFECIEKDLTPPADIFSAKSTLQIALAAFESSEKNKAIFLER